MMILNMQQILKNKIMTLNEQINADFITAFKEGNKEKKTFLSIIKSEIKNNEGRGILPTDDNVTSVIIKMNKSLNEVLKAGDINASIEIEWLTPYLPKLMSDSEITNEVQILVNNGANNIGSIMGQFNKKFQGKADNSKVKLIAEQILI